VDVEPTLEKFALQAIGTTELLAEELERLLLAELIELDTLLELVVPLLEGAGSEEPPPPHADRNPPIKMTNANL